MNESRGPVRVWRFDPSISHSEVAYEFRAGAARHVHGVYCDPYDPGALWVSVGDYAGECHIVQTRDRFASVKAFGDGTQVWRAVNLFFTPNYVAWLADSNLEQNYACRMDRTSGRLETGQKIDCPGWYGATTKERISIAFTTVEKGPGVQSHSSSVLASYDAFHWDRIMSFRKDIYRPVQVFKYGVISCPSGDMSASDFWISGEGVVGLDGCGMRVELVRRVLGRISEAIEARLASTPSREELRTLLAREYEALAHMMLSGQGKEDFQAGGILLSRIGIVSGENSAREIPTEIDLEGARKWRGQLSAGGLLTSSALVLMTGTALAAFDKSGTQEEAAFAAAAIERLLRHVEAQRELALSEMYQVSGHSRVFDQKCGVAILFSGTAVRRIDLRLLNAAFKLNDWIYGEWGRRFRQLDALHRARFIRSFAEQEHAAEVLL